MGLIEIDGPKALELLQGAVDEKGPEYVYPQGDEGCSYVREGRPSCMIGVALSRAGVSVDVLRVMDRGDWADPSGEPGDSAILIACEVSAELFGFSTDDAAEVAFDQAQRMQDNGGTWGRALEVAREAVALRTP